MSSPRVSVLMTGRCVASTLERALQSIEAQTYTDWELIYIDDQSTDSTRAVFDAFVRNRTRRPDRYRWVSTQARRGFVGCLNDAIELAKGQLLARMDADDESKLDRFKRQVDSFDTDPQLGIVGAQCLVQAEGSQRALPSLRPQSDQKIRTRMALVNPFVHGAVMVRRDILEKVGVYREDFTPQTGGCEDYELWLRVLEVAKGLNLPDFLYVRHESENGLTRTANPWKHIKRHFWIATQSVKRLKLGPLAYPQTLVPVFGILLFAAFRFNKERGHSVLAGRNPS